MAYYLNTDKHGMEIDLIKSIIQLKNKSDVEVFFKLNKQIQEIRRYGNDKRREIITSLTNILTDIVDKQEFSYIEYVYKGMVGKMIPLQNTETIKVTNTFIISVVVDNLSKLAEDSTFTYKVDTDKVTEDIDTKERKATSIESISKVYETNNVLNSDEVYKLVTSLHKRLAGLPKEEREGIVEDVVNLIKHIVK